MFDTMFFCPECRTAHRPSQVAEGGLCSVCRTPMTGEEIPSFLHKKETDGEETSQLFQTSLIPEFMEGQVEVDREQLRCDSLNTEQLIYDRAARKQELVGDGSGKALPEYDPENPGPHESLDIPDERLKPPPDWDMAKVRVDLTITHPKAEEPLLKGGITMLMSGAFLTDVRYPEVVGDVLHRKIKREIIPRVVEFVEDYRE